MDERKRQQQKDRIMEYARQHPPEKPGCILSFLRWFVSWPGRIKVMYYSPEGCLIVIIIILLCLAVYYAYQAGIF
jgi:hypothetical protein